MSEESTSDVSPFSDSSVSSSSEGESENEKEEPKIEAPLPKRTNSAYTNNYSVPYVDKPNTKDRQVWETQKKETTVQPAKRKYSKVNQKPKKDPNQPKKYLTPYMFFLKETRPEIKQKLLKEKSSAPLNEVMKSVGDAWRNLPEAEKQRYQRLSESDAERYSKQLSEYKEKLNQVVANEEISGDGDTEEMPKKKPRRNQRQDKQKRLKVREKGEEFFDRIVLTQYTVNKLKTKIQEKRKDYRPIAHIIQLPDVRIRDNQDVVVLEDDAELEFTFENKPKQNVPVQRTIQTFQEVPPELNIEEGLLDDI